jgi:hypothetical protein
MNIMAAMARWVGRRGVAGRTAPGLPAAKPVPASDAPVPVPVPVPAAVLEHFDVFGSQTLATATRVDGAGADWVRVNNISISAPVLVGNRFLLQWGARDPRTLTRAHLALLTVLRPLPGAFPVPASTYTHTR